MDSRTVRHIEETKLYHQKEQTLEANNNIRYNERDRMEILKTLQRIETKLDVLLMQKLK